VGRLEKSETGPSRADNKVLLYWATKNRNSRILGIKSRKIWLPADLLDVSSTPRAAPPRSHETTVPPEAKPRELDTENTVLFLFRRPVKQDLIVRALGSSLFRRRPRRAWLMQREYSRVLDHSFKCFA